MRKILNLIKSEWIKLFSRASTYIIILIVVAMPIGLVCINYNWYNDDSDYTSYEDYVQTNINDLKNELTYYEGATDKESQLNIKLINEDIAIFEEYKTVIDEEVWQQEIYADYLQAKYSVFIAQLIKDGYTQEDIQYSYYSNLYVLDITCEEAIKSSYESNIDSYITKKQAESVNLKEKYNRNSYLEHATQEHKEYSDMIAQNQKEFAKLEKRLVELNKQKLDKEKELEIVSIKDQMENINIDNECYNEYLYAYQYVVDNKIDDITRWECGVVEHLVDLATELAYARKNIMTESEYKNSDEYTWGYADYAAYVYSQIGWPAESIAEAKCSLEEHINIYDNTAVDYIEGYSGVMSVVGIAGIFVAGAMVSHEYSTGTIRFLLTRPVKRWKILFSKLFVLLAFLCILAIIWVATTFVTAGIFGDFSDFTIPLIQATFNGETVDVELQSVIVETLKAAGCSLLYVSFFVILTFAISAILKSTVFSMGLGMGSLLGCNMIEGILSMSEAFNKNPLKFEWLKYTPLPYSSFSAYYQMSSFDPYSIWPKIGANINLGITVMLGCSVILLIIAFIVFNGLDVKNQ